MNRTSRVLSASAVLAAATLLSVAPVAAQNWKAAPFYETLNLTAGFMPDPVSRSLQAGGVDSNSIDGTGCAGFINAERPDYDLNYTAGSSSLYIYARSGSDITLLVNDPSGSWHCSDDWDGTDPMIHFESPSSGNYNVWVGTYSSGQTQDATLYFTEMDPSGSVEEMPDVSAVPVYETITLSSGFMPDPVSRSLQAGGGSPNPVSGPGCLGYINLDAPDFDLNYTAGSPPLYIYARSESDITLLVNDPSGSWHCSDDWDGTDPMIHFESPSSGNYNVWVGTYSSGQTRDATLHFSEIAPSGSDRGFGEGMPDISAAPVYETITLSSGFTPDPVSRSLQAGGGSANPVSGPDCRGYINLDAPDFDLNYTAGSLPLYISAESDADITLLVNDANGTWHCSDDWDGTNPMIHLPDPPSGNYNIWVGTYASGELQEATLHLSEVSPK